MRRPDSIRLNSNCPKEGAPHPCPKPLGFMRKLVNRVAPSPADTILDPFMGSGTTGVAAIQLGHKFIGIEINGDGSVLTQSGAMFPAGDLPRGGPSWKPRISKRL